MEADADCIVTGDQHLLDLGSYGGIPIMTPAQFAATFLADEEAGDRTHHGQTASRPADSEAEDE